jgi:phospholipid/cholesterol/gamma-HCH transport system substrate-binding protein
MTSMRSHVLTILAAAAVAGGFLALLLLSGGSSPSIRSGSYRVSILAPTAVSLTPGSEVRVAGLQVGRVDGIRLQGRRSVIDLAIDEDTARLPRDTRFDVRLRTVIGETYVALYPGTAAGRLPDGAVLPMSNQANEYVDVEQILDVLKGTRRDRARDMVRGLGDGLRGRGSQLNAFVGRTSGVVDGLAPLMKVLHNDRAQVARLVDQTGTLAGSLADRSAAIGRVARQGRLAAEAVATRDDALRATIVALPSTLRQGRRTLGTLRSATGDAAPVLSNLAQVVSRLRPSVKRLEPAATRGRTLVRELGAATPALRRTLKVARTLSAPTAGAMPQIRSALCQANPMIGYLAPYAREVAATIQNLASATNYYDANGHAVRVAVLVGDNNFAGMPAVQADAMKLLLNSGIFGRTHKHGYNPYPVPGDVGPPSTGLGQTGPRDYEGTYRRIEAAC